MFGFLRRLFGHNRVRPIERPSTVMGMVLLPEPGLPAPEGILAAYGDLSPVHELHHETGDEEANLTEAQGYHGNEGDTFRFILAMMPTPVPEGEAEANFGGSVAALSGDEGTLDHKAHAIVVLQPGALMMEDALELWFKLATAVGVAANSPGIYFGNGCATHPLPFVKESVVVPEMLPMLWCGIAMRRAVEPGRMQLLSGGLHLFGQPELLLDVDIQAEGAIPQFYDLVGYIAAHGSTIRDGHTLGFDADTKWPVCIVPSPLEPSARVFHVTTNG